MGYHVSRPAEDRFWEKVDKTGECWLWTGARTNRGHGNFSLGGKRGTEKYVKPHRFVYELVNGPIPEGFDVDHECHNLAANLGLCNGGATCQHRLCVNPAHLAAKTRSENLRDSPLVGNYRVKAD